VRYSDGWVQGLRYSLRAAVEGRVEGVVLGGGVTVNIIGPVTHEVLLVEEGQVGTEETVAPSSVLTEVKHLALRVGIRVDAGAGLLLATEGGAGDVEEGSDGLDRGGEGQGRWSHCKHCSKQGSKQTGERCHTRPGGQGGGGSLHPASCNGPSSYRGKRH